MQVSALVHVDADIAATFPSRPDRVREAMDAAESAMMDLAAGARRHLSSPPELAEMRDTKLGIVELTFVAATESD